MINQVKKIGISGFCAVYININKGPFGIFQQKAGFSAGIIRDSALKRKIAGTGLRHIKQNFVRLIQRVDFFDKKYILYIK